MSPQEATAVYQQHAMQGAARSTPDRVVQNFDLDGLRAEANLLEESLYKAISRLSDIADQLVGPEPVVGNWTEATTAGSHHLGEKLSQCNTLLQRLHLQLSRITP